MNTVTCSHQWIDPNDPPIERASYSPILGPGRHQMKPGHRYQCQRCKQWLRVAPVRSADNIPVWFLDGDE